MLMQVKLGSLTGIRLYFNYGDYKMSCEHQSSHPVFYIQRYRLMLNKFSCTRSYHNKHDSNAASHANIAVPKHKYCHRFTTVMRILSALWGGHELNRASRRDSVSRDHVGTD